MRTVSVVAVGVLLLGVGYVAGVGGAASDGGRGSAAAGPVWDEGSKSFVTGENDSLTSWRIEDGKVVEATNHFLSWSPAYYETKPAEEGKEAEKVETFPAGNYIFTRTFKPAPKGLPAPAAMGFRPAPTKAAGGAQPGAVPAPAPAGGGQMACGAGKCG